jgi:sulfur carrier protein
MTECTSTSSTSITSSTTDTLLTLRLNGQALQVPAGHTLAQLIDQHTPQPRSLATAVNGRFVPREQRGQTVLLAGDEVLTFEAIVGG